MVKHAGFFLWSNGSINISMKKILIVNQEKPRKEIISDIVKDAKAILNYNRDVLKRRLKGLLYFSESDFYRILRRIIKNELPEIREIIICKTDRFEKYIEMC